MIQAVSEPLLHVFANETFDSVAFSEERYKARHIAFRNTTFNNELAFNSTDLSFGLLFENCRFKSSVTFRNIRSASSVPELKNTGDAIVFKNCEFSGLVSFEGKDTSIEKTLSFEKSHFQQGFDLQGITVSQNSVSLTDCTLDGFCSLMDVSVKGTFTFTSNTINTLVSIQKLECDQLSFYKKNVLNEEIWISEGVFVRGILFSETTCRKEVNLTLAKSLAPSGGLTIENSSFEKSVTVNFQRSSTTATDGLRAFYLTDCSFKNGITVKGNLDLETPRPKVEMIDIQLSSDVKGNLIFRDLDVGTLTLSGYNSDATLIFERLSINQININGLINNSGLIFSTVLALPQWQEDSKEDVLTQSKLSITNSNFGKAQFFQTDFSTFSSYVFENNILMEISTSMFTWFTREQLDLTEGLVHLRYKHALVSKDAFRIEIARATLIKELQANQEIFRQLKIASQRQGDVPKALEFQHREMIYYRRVVQYKKPRNWNEHLILTTSRTNSFGQNWLKAVGLFLVFSFFTFIPVGLLNSTKLNYSELANEWSDVWLTLQVIFVDNLKYWVLLMNPAHSLKDLNADPTNLSGWIYFWDFFSRIIISYFLFQIVSAFRKFNK